MKYIIRTALYLVLMPLAGNVLAQEVTIDLSQEYQVIRGFGGMNHTTWIPDLNEDNRKKAFGNNPGELAI